MRQWVLSLVVIGSAIGAPLASAQDFDSLVPGAAATAPAARAQAVTPGSRSTPPAPPKQPERGAPARPQASATRVEAPSAIRSGPITVTTSLSRTAVWVGEPVVFTVDVVCPPGTDIMPSDIARDRLRPSGIEVVDAVETRSVGTDGTRHYRTDFRLVSYSIDGSPVALEPQAIRYYVHTAGQAPDTLVPADEVQLPPVSLAVRSSLPDSSVTWLRDTRAQASIPTVLVFLTPAGWLLVALGAVAFALAGWTTWQQRGHLRVARRPRQTPALRSRLADVRDLDLTRETSRLDAFAAVNEIIRGRLADLDIPSAALTADELGPELARHARLDGRDLQSVLRTCEEALYGGVSRLPPASAAALAVECAEQLLSGKGASAR